MTTDEARRIARRVERETSDSRHDLAIADATDAVLVLTDNLDAATQRAALLQVVVDALPRCSECSRPATAAQDGELKITTWGPAVGVCDEHADRDPPRGYSPDLDLPWAAALRALAQEMGG